MQATLLQVKTINVETLGNKLGMAGPRSVRGLSGTTITAQTTFDTVDIPNISNPKYHFFYLSIFACSVLILL